MAVTTRTHKIYDAIRECITVPDNIVQAANAIGTDLIHGPAWCIVDADGNVVETYLSMVDALDNCEPRDYVKPAYSYAGKILREYIDNLPSMYYEAWNGYVSIGVIDYDVANTSDVEYIDSGVIIAALFGTTISRNFW